MAAGDTTMQCGQCDWWLCKGCLATSVPLSSQGQVSQGEVVNLVASSSSQDQVGKVDYDEQQELYRVNTIDDATKLFRR